MKKSFGTGRVVRVISAVMASMMVITSTPLTTFAEADEKKIVVEDLRDENNDPVAMDFSSNNLNENSNQAVSDAKAADSSSDAAQKKVDAIAADAKEAADAADNAMQAANNANAIAEQADELLKALTPDGTDNLASQIASATDLNPNNDNAQKAYNIAADKINNPTTGAEARITAAETAKTSADEAINGKTDANGKKVGGAENAINDINAKIKDANDAIDAADKSKNGDPKDSSDKGTEGLIAAANKKLEVIEGKEVNGQKTGGLEGSAKAEYTRVTAAADEVRKAVAGAEGKYQAADEQAKKDIQEIFTTLKDEILNPDNNKEYADESLNESSAVNKAMTGAAEESGKASKALSDTWSDYYAVKSLVDQGSNDVQVAASYARSARENADNAQQAADNAAAFAAAAAIAEKNAETDLLAAEAALSKAQGALNKAMGLYNDAYSEAKTVATKADADADTLNNGDIKTYNETTIINLETAITNYNNTEVANANSGIAATNKLVAEQDRLVALVDTTDAINAIQAANSAIRALYGNSDDENLIKLANKAIEDANTAIDALLGDGTDANKGKKQEQLDAISAARTALNKAYKAYTDKIPNYVANSNANKTAQQYAEEAQRYATTASQNAAAVLDEAETQATLELLNNSVDTARDALGGLILGKGAGYNITEEITKAENDLKQAKDYLPVLTKEVEDNIAEINNGIAGINNDIAGIEGDIARLEAEAGEYEEKIKAEDEKLYGKGGTAKKPTADSLQGRKNTVDTAIKNEEKTRAYKNYKEALKIVKDGVTWFGLGIIGNSQEQVDRAQRTVDAYEASEAGKKYLSNKGTQSSLATQIETANSNKNSYQSSINSITGMNGSIAKKQGEITSKRGEITKKEGEITEQNNRITYQNNVVIKGKQDALTAKQAELAKVDDFKFTGANTFTIDLDKIAEIKLQDEAAYNMLVQLLSSDSSYSTLVSKLSSDYGSVTDIKKDTLKKLSAEDQTQRMNDWGNNFSYLMADWDTDKYRNVNKGWGWHPISAYIDYTDGWYEYEIEQKYDNTWLDKHFIDGNVQRGLESYTNYQCTVVCTDLDKMSLLRATFAQAKFNAAQAVATAANAKATAAKKSLKEFKSNETEAKSKYDDAIAALNTAEQAINALTLSRGKYTDEVDDPKYTEYAQDTSGNYTAIKTLKTSVTGYDSTIAEKTWNNDVKKSIDTIAKVNEKKRLGNAFKVREVFGKITVDGKEIDLGTTTIEELTQLIETLSNKVEDAKGALEKAREDRKAADKKYDDAKKDAEEADRVAKAAAELAKRVVPATPDTSDDSPSSSSSDSDDDSDAGDTYYYAGTPATTAGTIPVIPLGATGVAGARTTAGRTTGRGAGAGRGVLGARVEGDGGEGTDNTTAGTTTVVANKTENKTDADKNKNGVEVVKVDNPEQPLAAAPTEQDLNLNLLWLLAAVVVIAGTIYGYEKHKKKAVAAEDMKKYKKQ